MAKVSIISPVYNVEKYIANLIKSVDNQTFRDFELLLIDDGSTDNSIEIAKKKLEKVDFRYQIISKKNGGQSSARNLGFDKAQGEYVCTIDSDDVIQPDYVENLINAIEQSESDVAFCNINMVNDSNLFDITSDKFVWEKKSGGEYFYDFFMHNVQVGPCSLLIKKDYLDNIKLRYNEKSRYSEEFIFICHLLHDAKSVVHLKQRLYNYCLRSGSVSTSAKIDKILNGYNEILKCNEKYVKCNCEYCKLYNKYAMPRWILATSRFTAKNIKFTDYKMLLKKLEYRKNIRPLYNFPKFPIKVAVLLLRISLPISYLVFKKVSV